MTAKQYKLTVFAQQLQLEQQRDRALIEARELSSLAHRLGVVRALITEARLCHHRVLKYRRLIRWLEE